MWKQWGNEHTLLQNKITLIPILIQRVMPVITRYPRMSQQLPQLPSDRKRLSNAFLSQLQLLRILLLLLSSEIITKNNDRNGRKFITCVYIWVSV